MRTNRTLSLSSVPFLALGLFVGATATARAQSDAVDSWQLSSTQVPAECTFRGDFMSSVGWYDKGGINAVVFSQKSSDDSSWTLFVTHCRVDNATEEVTVVRRFRDTDSCDEGDFNMHPLMADTVRVRDVNRDGWKEVWFAYYKFTCMSDMSPMGVRYVALENGKKHIMRGFRSTVIAGDGEVVLYASDVVSQAPGTSEWSKAIRHEMRTNWEARFGNVVPKSARLAELTGRSPCGRALGTLQDGTVVCFAGPSDLSKGSDPTVLTYASPSNTQHVKLSELVPAEHLQGEPNIEINDEREYGVYLSVGSFVRRVDLHARRLVERKPLGAPR